MMHFDLDHCHSFWRSFAYTIEIDGSEQSVFLPVLWWQDVFNEAQFGEHLK